MGLFKTQGKLERCCTMITKRIGCFERQGGKKNEYKEKDVEFCDWEIAGDL